MATWLVDVIAMLLCHHRYMSHDTLCQDCTISLDIALQGVHITRMATQPQQYYSYDEVALLCRRSRGYIKSLCSRLKIPRIRQRHVHRSQRIALLPLESVQTLQRRTLLRPR